MTHHLPPKSELRSRRDSRVGSNLEVRNDKRRFPVESRQRLQPERSSGSPTNASSNSDVLTPLSHFTNFFLDIWATFPLFIRNSHPVSGTRAQTRCVFLHLTDTLNTHLFYIK